MGIEALSRGAQRSFFVDINKTAEKIVRENVSRLDLDADASVECKDALVFLNSLKQKHSGPIILYFDPPYDEIGLYKKVLVKLDKLQLTQLTLLVEHRHSLSSVTLNNLHLIRKKQYGDKYLSIFTTTSDI